MEEPEDEALFKWGYERGKLGSNLPYKDTFPNYNVRAASTFEATLEVAPVIEASVKETDAPDV